MKTELECNPEVTQEKKSYSWSDLLMGFAILLLVMIFGTILSLFLSGLPLARSREMKLDSDALSLLGEDCKIVKSPDCLEGFHRVHDNDPHLVFVATARTDSQLFEGKRLADLITSLRIRKVYLENAQKGRVNCEDYNITNHPDRICEGVVDKQYDEKIWDNIVEQSHQKIQDEFILNAHLSAMSYQSMFLTPIANTIESVFRTIKSYRSKGYSYKEIMKLTEGFTGQGIQYVKPQLLTMEKNVQIIEIVKQDESPKIFISMANNVIGNTHDTGLAKERFLQLKEIGKAPTIYFDCNMYKFFSSSLPQDTKIKTKTCCNSKQVFWSVVCDTKATETNPESNAKEESSEKTCSP